jgi:hypothetical protein
MPPPGYLILLKPLYASLLLKERARNLLRKLGTGAIDNE